MSRRWAVILGASSGFGAATARALASEGWAIFGVHLDRRNTMPAVEALVAELSDQGVPVVFHNGNAASDDSRTLAIASLREAMGADDTVGILLHSLAFGTLRPYFNQEGRSLGRRQLDMTLDESSKVANKAELYKSASITDDGPLL